jgi:hypothetical protein
MSQTDWTRTVDLVTKYLGVKASSLPPVANLYTNKFVPTG